MNLSFCMLDENIPNVDSSLFARHEHGRRSSGYHDERLIECHEADMNPPYIQMLACQPKTFDVVEFPPQ